MFFHFSRLQAGMLTQAFNIRGHLLRFISQLGQRLRPLLAGGEVGAQLRHDVQRTLYRAVHAVHRSDLVV